MKIKCIELNNYRLYKGVNKVLFNNSDNKNLYLISGENGFGKTTFLQSLLWCLYGRLMANIDESFRKEMSNGGYNNILLSNLNDISRRKLESKVASEIIDKIKKEGYRADNEYVKKYSLYSVSLEFSDILIPSIPCQTLKITRAFDTILGEENVEVLIDGVETELTTEMGNEIFINDFILSKDVARFFFFDSEKIVSLAETNTLTEKRKLSTAYNEVLGVRKYEELKRNLENMRLRFRKQSSDIAGRNKLNALLLKQKLLIDKNAKQEELLIKLEKQLSRLKKEDEELQIKLLREGNSTTIEELNRLKALLEKLREKDVIYKQQIKKFMEFAPFAISGSLFKQTKIQIDNDYKIFKSESDIRNQNFLLSNIIDDMKEVFNNADLTTDNKKQLMNSFNSVISKYQSIASGKPALLNVNDKIYREFNSVFSNIISTYRIEFEHLADDFRKNQLVLNRTRRKITNMHSKESDDVIKYIRKKKNEKEMKISKLGQEILEIHIEEGAIDNELTLINEKVKELSKKVSLDDSNVKKDKVAEKLIDELNVFLISLKKEKKSALEWRIKSTMNKLMHKTDFIENVEVIIDDDIIDINLYSKDNVLIKKDTLSKGEQQLYATSLLKALVDESGIQFPVFIDSPLQKFDKSHANKIITEFYPTVSKQVILFPLLHRELSEKELNIMKPFLNTTYLIKNNNFQSHIKEIEIDNLMKE